VPPLTRDTSLPPGVASTTESGVVLDIEDAIEVKTGASPPRPSVRSQRPVPPPPSATDPMLHPSDMMIGESISILPWWRRSPRLTLGALALLVVVIVAAKAFTGGRRKTS